MTGALLYSSMCWCGLCFLLRAKAKQYVVMVCIKLTDDAFLANFFTGGGILNGMQPQ